MVNATGLQYLNSYQAFPAPKSRSKHTPTSVTRSLATWPRSTHTTGHEPKQSDKMITADDDATPINDPEHTRTLDGVVFLQSVKPLFR